MGVVVYILAYGSGRNHLHRPLIKNGTGYISLTLCLWFVFMCVCLHACVCVCVCMCVVIYLWELLLQVPIQLVYGVYECVLVLVHFEIGCKCNCLDFFCQP